ncbi:MAG TPA: hypothetical protein VNV85_07790 [Puia sp.]|jgi:hypothetical protein|nr:hypothetical protein [Puia sp.]
MLIKYAFAICLVFTIVSCNNLKNRVREAVWVDIPYAVDKGVDDSNRRLSFVTKQKNYALVDSVNEIGFNDKYLIVLSNKGSNDTLKYWIVDKSIQDLAKIEKKENIDGPMGFLQFSQKKKSLNIDTLAFTVEIK